MWGLNDLDWSNQSPKYFADSETLIRSGPISTKKFGSRVPLNRTAADLAVEKSNLSWGLLRPVIETTMSSV